MPGNWGTLDCPNCGHTNAAPERPTVESEHLVAELTCPKCQKGWEVRVELWRYYGIEPELPSREEDR